MNFYSGFCLSGEEEIFSSYHDRGEFCISGFSLGAIEAFEYVIQSKKRIDKLQLFSPAFFMDKNLKFKRLQEMFFKKDKKSYLDNFFKNIAYPSQINMQDYYDDSPQEALHKLLSYEWPKKHLHQLRKKGIVIEVYLGSEDKIIDVEKTKVFFRDVATIIMIKDVGHILKEKNG